MKFNYLLIVFLFFVLCFMFENKYTNKKEGTRKREWGSTYQILHSENYGNFLFFKEGEATYHTQYHTQLLFDYLLFVLIR